MNRTERYLRRATLGLWGQRRREAQMELRGAIEDKLWRFEHLGLTPGEAERRALAELGPARAVAGGLSRVHSVPVGVQGALLAAVLGVVGVQMVAAQTVVKAVPYQNEPVDCSGKPVSDQASCREFSEYFNVYLPIDKLNSALRSVGFDPAKMRLNQGSLDYFGVDEYVNLFSLTQALLQQPELSLSLQGERNPILTIGGKRLTLGTPDAPVRDYAVVLAAVMDNLRPRLSRAIGTDRFVTAPDFSVVRMPGQQVLTGLTDGRYVYVTTLPKGVPDCPCNLQIRLQTVIGGDLVIGDAKTRFTPVSTPTALAAAKAKGVPAVLFYRLGPVSDLRNLPLSLVNTSTLKIVTK